MSNPSVIFICSGDSGVVYIQSASSVSSAGYGDSSSSSCFLSASFCIHLMASAKGVGLDAESMRHFSTPAQPAPGISGDPRDMGVSWLDPHPESGAQETPMSMGKPGGSLSSRGSSQLVTGEDTLLARPLTPESFDRPELGKVMGGMGVVSSAYTGSICGPGVEDAVLDAMGLYTSSRPNSLLRAASLLAASVSLGMA